MVNVTTVVLIAQLVEEAGLRGRSMTSYNGVYRAIVLMLGLVLLSACAGSAPAPDVVQAMAPTVSEGLRLADITAEAKPGVAMTPADIDRIISQIKADIAAKNPDVLVDKTASPDVMKIEFTRYDSGSAFARFMLMGLGQIKIDADVSIVNSTSNQVVGEYDVSKDFAFGGIYGGVTRIEDVEKGFAKSVAEIVENQTS